MNENKAGLGYQDFEEVRTEHIFYIDKIDFINDLDGMNEFMNKVALYTFQVLTLQKACQMTMHPNVFITGLYWD